MIHYRNLNKSHFYIQTSLLFLSLPELNCSGASAQPVPSVKIHFPYYGLVVSLQITVFSMDTRVAKHKGSKLIQTLFYSSHTDKPAFGRVPHPVICVKGKLFSECQHCAILQRTGAKGKPRYPTATNQQLTFSDLMALKQ